ncbi:hypothetical protein EZ449_13965 [Pedobacter frigidisoli]|uniref:YD repeat-containing protein n=1 Tax=Pedobacter frigidisoli TaxID=2530455 RepID=A0A4R0P2J3_9SPHI|nr:hypothetical protein [Pedobacter frigidisoli]TCD07638.1 hypothetical protein EZ449_13965 [Pedobacter frigidisoli]
MIRILNITTISLLFVSSWAMQMNKDSAVAINGTLLTKTVKSTSSAGSETSTSKILYTSSASGDQYFAYTFANGAISDAIGYRLANTPAGLSFISERLFSGQHEADSIHIAFDDAQCVVRIGKTDQYMLFPASYSQFKQEVNVRHKVLSLAGLLEDNIGDYPIEDLLQLIMVSSKEKTNFKTRQAQVNTLRSQSDDTRDNWSCRYAYDKAGKMLSVRAFNKEEVRFSKTLTYNPKNLVLKSHRNIEDRQITERTMVIDSQKPGKLRWTDKVIETGKNLETTLATEISKRETNFVQKARMSQMEVLNLFKTK